MSFAVPFALGLSFSLLVAAAAWLRGRRLQRSFADAQESLRRKLSESKERARNLTAELECVAEDSATSAAVTARQSAELYDAARMRRAYERRVRRAMDLEGALWTQRTMANTPKFVPLAKRGTPIVSVLNLKGGVGKTTITAYLAQALAQSNLRVLMVDLDLQGSLSSLFIRTLELARMSERNNGKFLHDLLSQPVDEPPRGIAEYAHEIPKLGPHARIIPTTDKLAYAELSLTVQWLLRTGGENRTWNGRRDGRMILRRALHRRGELKPFDVVLLDCPPLINLCCANALAASDFILAPVTPSLKSIERVPALLNRVREIQSDVNPQLEMLGLVINNTKQKSLTAQESDLFLTLPEQCRETYGEPVEQFDTTIPGVVAIRDNEEQFSALAEDSAIHDTFERLAEEFWKRLAAARPTPQPRRRRAGKS